VQKREKGAIELKDMARGWPRLSFMISTGRSGGITLALPTKVQSGCDAD
jgi:hypothetical protein